MAVLRAGPTSPRKVAPAQHSRRALHHAGAWRLAAGRGALDCGTLTPVPCSCSAPCAGCDNATAGGFRRALCTPSFATRPSGFAAATVARSAA
jgi:hypothetical protein